MSILSKVVKGVAIYAAGKYVAEQLKKNPSNKDEKMMHEDCNTQMFEEKFGAFVDSEEDITNGVCDNECLHTLRKHWNSRAVITDIYNSDTLIEDVQEKDLLAGELSAQIFQIGSYVVRSAQRVYTMYDPGYNPEKEFPVDDETLERVKKELEKSFMRPIDGIRITHEISAKRISEQEEGFVYICRAAHARNYSWDEVIGSICTAKEMEDLTDESESLFVQSTYIGSSFSVDTWYKFDSTGEIATLKLHPFDSDIDKAQFQMMER